jgi:hypothetical protein
MEENYIEQLKKNLAFNRARLQEHIAAEALLSTEAGQFVLKVIDDEITIAVNAMTKNEALDRDTYLSLHGRVRGLRSIRNVITARAEDDTTAKTVREIDDQLRQFES